MPSGEPSRHATTAIFIPRRQMRCIEAMIIVLCVHTGRVHGDGELEASVRGLSGAVGQLVRLVHASKHGQRVRAAGSHSSGAPSHVHLPRQPHMSGFTQMFLHPRRTS